MRIGIELGTGRRSTGGGAVPVLLVAPAITGGLTQGSDLTFDVGLWTGADTFEIEVTQTTPTATLLTRQAVIGTTTGTLSTTVGGSLTLNVWATNASGTTLASSAVFGPVVAGYLTNMVEFDGTNDWLYLESGFAGGAGGKTGLICGNIYITSAWPSSTKTLLSMASATGIATIALTTATTGRLSLLVRNSANAAIVTMTASTSQFLVDTGYTIMLAWDTATSTRKFYKRPWGGAWAAVTLGTDTITADGIAEGVTKCRFAAATSAGVGLLPQFYAGDFWADVNQTIDATDAAARDEFLPTVDKGATGSVPTGVAPILYLSGVTASWHTNKGTGTGLTKVGTLTDAPVTPS